MTPEKKKWLILAALTLVIAAGAGYLIYDQQGKIEGWRTESETLRTKITADRELIKGTPDLVKEVIIQRETDEVIKRILSDEEDVNNFVRTLQEFEEQSGVSITSMKPKRDVRRGAEVSEFNNVAYTLNLVADSFEFLSFLDQVESYPRLMSVTSFSLTSGGRNLSANMEEVPRHKIVLDLETYVYSPTQGAQEVRIDQYDRKRETLIGEIGRRANELQVPRFEYHGRQNRRDPWIDPRIPVGGEDFLPIDQQVAIVGDLVDRCFELEKLWTAVEEADNYIAEVKARSECEAALIQLEEEVRRVEGEGALSYIPVERRFQVKVVATAREIREKLENTDDAPGEPSLTALEQAIDAMRESIRAQDYEGAKEQYDNLSSRLLIAERNPLKQPLIETLKDLDRKVTAVLAFETLDLNITGIAIYEGYRPVALINGTSVTEGELLDGELIVRHIRPDHVEFDYRGVRLAHPVSDVSSPHPVPNGSRGGR